MCDPLRAKPLKWKDAVGLEAQVRRRISIGVRGISPFQRKHSEWAPPWQKLPFVVFVKVTRDTEQGSPSKC